MYISFDRLGDDSKIWIFQSSTEFNESEIESLSLRCRNFIENWTAHEKKLAGSFLICENRFLVFGVDEGLNGASGCSIDKLFNFIKGEEGQLNVRLLDRLLVTAQPNGEKVGVYSLAEAEKAIASGTWGPETTVYDTTITKMRDFRSGFRTSLKNTWLQRYLVNV